LSFPDNLPEAKCQLLKQFMVGKVSFRQVTQSLKKNLRDPDIRRSVIEAIGLATEHATLESTKALKEGLSDSDPFVRQAAMKSLCVVLAQAQRWQVVKLAQKMLASAENTLRHDAMELLRQLAMKGSGRAYNALDWHRSQDKDPLVQFKAEAEWSLVTAAGCADHGQIRSGAKIAMLRAESIDPAQLS